MARGRYQHGPGISVTARLSRLRIGADVLLRLPVSVRDDAADIRIAAGALRIRAAVPVLSAGGTSVSAGLGAGVDISRIEAATSRTDLAATPPFWATSPFLRLFAAVDRDVGPLSLAGIVGVDLDLLGERYLVAASSGSEEIFAPERLRPLVAIAIGLRR
jgi:hypothetical protein